MSATVDLTREQRILNARVLALLAAIVDETSAQELLELWERVQPDPVDTDAAPAPAVWVSEARTVLVTRTPGHGTMTVATRSEPDARWGPPVTVHPEGATE